MTVRELAKDFDTNYMQNRLRPSTLRGYRVNIEKHILPHLGDFNVEEVQVDNLDDLTRLLKPKLSNKSIVYVHATFRKMFSYAVRRRLVQNHPYDMFDMPRVEKYHYCTLNEEEIKRILELSANTEIGVAVLLAICYGLRRGECLGVIPAKDLDYRKRTLHVQRTRSVERGKEVITPCKTEKSNRKILLTAEHAAYLLSLMNGNEYACPLTPNQLNYKFKMFLEYNDLPHVRFHDLRHSFATLMLEKGIHPKIVSTVLGHSGVSVTLDIYSHPDVRMQEVCTQVISSL